MRSLPYPMVAIAVMFATSSAAQNQPFGLLRSIPDTLSNFAGLTLPSPYVYQNLGLFCKLDVHLERGFKIPVLLRLGDVRSVEAWEGKGPLVIPFEDR